jgi:hypothetical protein
MSIAAHLLALNGHTPMVRLRRVARDVEYEVLVKNEYLNPSGSIKDRIALRMIEDAERAGVLRPGMEIVEASTGNTATALAFVGAVKGYRVHLFIPTSAASEERLRIMKAYGAIVTMVDVSVDASGTPIEAPDGLIHHWIGAVFIPGVSLRQVLDLVEDYDDHQDIYRPEVTRSRLVEHKGNDYRIYYRLRKKKVITVTFNTNHDVHYFPVDSTHCHSRSIATRIAEVVDADQPDEHEKPIGHDGGFLWRMNSYWRFEEKDQGVYVEVESISLTRDIPTGLGWLIRAFVTKIPRESLLMTLGATRSALEARLHAASQK